MILRVLEKIEMDKIAVERNKVLETLRTPYMLNKQMQLDYYDKVLSDRKSDTRYFALFHRNVMVGYGGIENIIWENRNGEISLLIFEDYREKGNGKEAVELILDKAFNYLNLDHVYGECYMCANVDFWEKMIARFKGNSLILPCRKYYDGQYFDSLYFTFYKEGLNGKK